MVVEMRPCSPCRGLGKVMQQGALVACSKCRGTGEQAGMWLRDTWDRDERWVAIPHAELSTPATCVAKRLVYPRRAAMVTTPVEAKE